MLDENETTPPAEPARRSRDRVLWWLIPLGAVVIGGAFLVGVMLGIPPAHIRVVRGASPQFPPLPAMRLTTGLPARGLPAGPAAPSYRRPATDKNIDIAPDTGIQIVPGMNHIGAGRLNPPGFTRPAPMPSSVPAPAAPMPPPSEDHRSDDIAGGGVSEPGAPALFDRPPPAAPSGGGPAVIDSRPQQPSDLDPTDRTRPSAPPAARRSAVRQPAPSDAEARQRYRRFFDENDFQDER